MPAVPAIVRRTCHALTVMSVAAAGVLVSAPVAAAACPSSGGQAVPAAPAPAGDLVVRGGGWGHSLGMSQYGAQGAARLGCGHQQILATYYTGAAVTTRQLEKAVMVTLLTNGTTSTVQTQSGAVTWRAVEARRSAVQPQGATWTVVRTSSGQVLQDASGAEVLSAANGGELRAMQSGTVTRVRSLRGSTVSTDLRMRWDYTRFVATTAGLQAWQVIQDDANGRGPQKYLWGLAEVPASWPQEALRTQAVAARTYLARRWDAARNAYLIGTTTATQHWTGYAQELEDAQAGGHWRAAVDATADRVVTTESGALVDAVYSSSHGGSSEDARYVWGNDVPYLRPVDDSRWDLASDNPYRSWAKGFTRAQLADAFGLDSVTDVQVPARGTTARLDGATVTGVRSGKAVSLSLTGWELRQALGLRSPGVVSTTWVVPAGAVPLAGDWDGDGLEDLGWFRDGDFVLRHADGSTTRFRFGRAGDLPVVGDWARSGVDGIGIVRNGEWHLRDTPTGGDAQRRFRFGRPGDVPIVGRWPGAAGDGVGVVRGRTWYLRHSVGSGNHDTAVTYGLSSDRFVVGDWDGNGTDTPGVVRGAAWYLANAATGGAASVVTSFGIASDLARPGDFDGDGHTTTGIVRGGTWYWRDDLRGGVATTTVRFPF